MTKHLFNVLIDKKHPLSPNFIPAHLVNVDIPFLCEKNDEKRKMYKPAAKAMQKMYKQAKQEGLQIYGISAYRSYERQAEIFNESLATNGYDYTISSIARPGCSEHQSGLAIDVSSPLCSFKLDDSFRRTPEYLWLSKYCHKFGFIIRYPYGSQHITGFRAEPWHLRYVGEKTSTIVYSERITLEEYLQMY
ncbi:MAG: M15 family metallopeptidase [Lachnospiraceae bacterium]|nr:M15 family metallopeptidase [Lachnospiraceae bacterium]